MLRSLSTAAAGMTAQQTRMDVIAHNLANVNTTGFKQSRVEFEEVFSETIRRAQATLAQGGGAPSNMQIGLGVRSRATTRNMSQGQLVTTDNPLDLAIEGAGFLIIDRPDGTQAYSRAGNLRTDSSGRLVTQRGDLIAGKLEIPTDATTLSINSDGSVLATVPNRTAPIEVGSIELAMFPNPGGLLSMGGNLLTETEASGAPLMVRPGESGSGELAQGVLETSNVQAVTEMIDMITTQRAYEMSSKVIQAADAMLARLTNLR